LELLGNNQTRRPPRKGRIKRAVNSQAFAEIIVFVNVIMQDGAYIGVSNVGDAIGRAKGLLSIGIIPGIGVLEFMTEHR